ncbi:hypothetical protein EB796_017354 [Bugula neritina]|uniref:Protein sleepless n=1 Tax=Bugula neritina TaxID=10212 RepID=A0A7J7JET6_BUGNE|nr:hypothetical protein EB796_017354 [Bugula neritina]
MRVLIVAAVLCGMLAVSYAAGTKCYVCSSVDGECADEYTGDSSHEQDCSEVGYTDDGSCSKLKATAKAGGAKASTVTRSCGELYDNTKCEQKDRVKTGSGSAKAETWSCSCEGDLCNGGSQLTYSAALVCAFIMKFLF